METRNLRPLGFALIALVAADAAWAPIILAWSWLLPASFASELVPIAHVADAAERVFKIVTMIVFGCWIWLAGRNLVAEDMDGLEFSPASRVWWFLVPIASLFKPFQGMRELWNASRGAWPYDQNNTLISVWWAAWLLKSFGGLLLTLLVPGSGGASLWAISILGVGAAVPTAIIVHTISKAQSDFDRAALAEVFA